LIGVLFVIAIGVVVSILLLSNSDSAQPEIIPRGFITLGDSVSSGYGLTGYLRYRQPDEGTVGSHAFFLFEKLQSNDLVDWQRNLAVSGHTTGDLLELLHGLSATELEYFAHARVVTINIGGNNLLTPFFEYLTNLQVTEGGRRIYTGAGYVLSGGWGVIYEIISGVNSVASPEETDSFRIGNVFSNFGEIIKGFGELLVGTGDIIIGSPDVIDSWHGNLSPELQTMLTDGVQTFHNEFVEILDWLDQYAPHATIITNTIYNPIPHEVIRISIPISLWAGEHIREMNRTIRSVAADRGLVVVDVYSEFSGRPELTLINLNPIAGGISFDLVHPNLTGHAFIALLQNEAFTYYMNR